MPHLLDIITHTLIRLLITLMNRGDKDICFNLDKKEILYMSGQE